MEPDPPDNPPALPNHDWGPVLTGEWLVQQGDRLKDQLAEARARAWAESKPGTPYGGTEVVR